jgi:NAD(P)-dependent dehydrogenase (short-subunit alcohol dehydrogenase family)
MCPASASHVEYDMTPPSSNTALLIGASRGLGHAMACEYLQRGWRVIATGREHSTASLQTLAGQYPDALRVETVDITAPEQVAALRTRLEGEAIDLLFVNAGVTNDDDDTAATVSTDEFVRVMVTNALSPLRVVAAFEALVPASGTIGVMSSGQGSLANNTNGAHDVYRGSKAALNMYMRSFAARHADDARTLLLMAPGWVQTDMGGPGARLTIAESIPKLVDTITAQQGRAGLQYLDYLGRTVPW